MCYIIPPIPDLNQIDAEIQKGISLALKNMQEKEILRKINELYRVNAISFAGDMFYNKKGRLANSGKYKYKVEYVDYVNGNEHFIVLN